jgi:hypothetical protein
MSIGALYDFVRESAATGGWVVRSSTSARMTSAGSGPSLCQLKSRSTLPGDSA